MADADPEVKIRIGADTSGGEKAVKTLKKVKDESGGLIGALSKMKESVERARGALMSLGGATAIVTSIVKIFKDWSLASKELASDLDKVRADAAANSIAQLSEEERKTNEEIARGNDLRDRARALDEQRTSAVRRIQDAELRASKAKELAAVGTGPDADLRRREIEQKYSAIAGYNSLTREKEDSDRKAQELGERASSAETTAAEKERRAAEYADLSKSESREATRASAAAVRESRDDALWKFWSDGAENAKLLTENAAAHTRNASDAQKRAEQLRDEAAALREKAKALREEKASVEEMSGKVFEAEYAANMAEDAGTMKGIRTEQGARREKRERELAEVSRARSGMADTQGQIAAARRRLQEIQEGRYANDMAAARAGDAFELARANGRPVREQGAAYGRQQEIVRKTQDANHALDKAEAEILSTLEALTARLKQFERVVQNGEKRSKADASDAAGGGY